MVDTSASQSVVLRPTAAVSPRDLLEMSVLGEHPRPPGDFDAHWSLGTIALVRLQLLEKRQKQKSPRVERIGARAFALLKDVKFI